jgi:hypothetical protein
VRHRRAGDAEGPVAPGEGLAAELYEPYPEELTFGVPRQIACLPDGSVAVASTVMSGGVLWQKAPPRPTPVLVAGAPLPSNVNHDDGPARQAHFERFRSMCISPDGTFFISDKNKVIRKLTPAGQVTTWAF